MICKQGPQFMYCKVLERQNDLYTLLVVEDLKAEELTILTVFPNWCGEIPQKGDIGYIEFEFCEAGVTKYFDRHTLKSSVYMNSYLVFKQFVKETKKDNLDIII